MNVESQIDVLLMTEKTFKIEMFDKEIKDLEELLEKVKREKEEYISQINSALKKGEK